MNAVSEQFTGVTREHFDALAEKVQELTGVTITNDAGTTQDPKKEWKVSWVFNEPSGELTIQVLEAPWPKSLAPGAIGKALRNMVEDVLNS